MKTYRLYEGFINIPKAWKDQTLNAFSIPNQGKAGAKASFVVSRDSETKSETLEHYADLQLVEAAKKLPRYKLIRRNAAEVDGRPAMQADYTWFTPERIEIRQRQMFVAEADYFLIMTLTAQAKDFQSYEAMWKETLNSVSWQQQ